MYNFGTLSNNYSHPHHKNNNPPEMPPRHQTLPQAATASAREALQSFYCQLCQKGYSRHNEYEAHLSSYDHSHKVRLKEMRAMTRDPHAAARARKAEEKAGGVISIQLGGNSEAAAAANGGGGGAGGGGGGGFKKGGFKKSGFKNAFAPVGGGEAEDNAWAAGDGDAGVKRVNIACRDNTGESDTEDEGYEMYDPQFPTD